MTKERKTQIVTVSVLAGAFGVVLAQKSGFKLTEMKLADLAPQSAPKTELAQVCAVPITTGAQPNQQTWR